MDNETRYRMFDAIRNNDLKTIKSLKFKSEDLRELNNNKFSVLKLAYNFDNVGAFKYFLRILKNQPREITASVVNSIDYKKNKTSDFVFLYELSKNKFTTNALRNNDILKRKKNILSLTVFTCLVKKDKSTLKFIQENYFSERKKEFKFLMDSYNELGERIVIEKLKEHNPKVFNEYAKQNINNSNNEKYDGVQCISYAPATSNPDYNVYNGFENDTKDWQSRVTVMHDAINKVYDSNNIERNSKCLKIFMVPEFFFRGKKGAYTLETTDKITNSLKRMVASPKYKDWLFVFGTTVGYSKENERKYQLYTAYNYSFIQKGGSNEKDSLIVMKEEKSKIDFINDRGQSDKLTSYNTRYLEKLPIKNIKKGRNEEKNFNYDSSAIFEIGGLRFAVEICLDNIKKRIDASNLESNKQVDVLLVPSCGVESSEACKRMSNKGVVFTVDGAFGESYISLQNNRQPEPLYSEVFNPNNKNLAQKLFRRGGRLSIYPAQNLKKNKIKEFQM